MQFDHSIYILLLVFIELSSILRLQCYESFVVCAHSFTSEVFLSTDANIQQLMQGVQLLQRDRATCDSV